MENYKIISFEEANFIRQKEKLRMKYQMPDNYAIVYETTDKQILLFPATGNKVVLFPNEDVMKEVVNEIGVPIPSNNIFLKNSHLIAEWEQNVEAFLRQLSNTIEINLNDKIELDKLAEISKAINKLIKGMTQDEIFDTYHLTFGALLGKIIIDNFKNAEWELHKYYDVNPYYIPMIELDGKRLPIFKPILDEIARRNIRLNNCLNRLSIKTSP